MVNMVRNSNLVALTDGVTDTGAVTAGFVAATTASSGAGATTSGYVTATSASSVAGTTTTSFVAATSANSEAGVATVAVIADQLHESFETDLSSTSGGLPSDFDAEFGKFREGPQEQSEHIQQPFVDANEQVLQPLNTVSAIESLPIIETIVFTEHCEHTDSFCLSNDPVIDCRKSCEQGQDQVAVPDANLSVTAEPTQCQVADVPKEAKADQQVGVSDDGFQNQRCNNSAELVNDATDSLLVKQKFKKVDDSTQLCSIDFEGGNNNYAYLDYGGAVEWRIHLAKDRELLKSLIGREKNRSARAQSKMLTSSVMRPSRIKAFGGKVVDAKSSNVSSKINSDVIQCMADQEEKYVVEVSTIDDKVDGDQARSIADASKSFSINGALESSSATSSSQVQNDSGCQNSGSPAHEGQFQQVHKDRRGNVDYHTWRQRSTRSSGKAGDFRRRRATSGQSRHAPRFNHYVPQFAWVPYYFVVQAGWCFVDVSAMPNAYYW
ncbi:OLC1v1008691C1 [Oldenlandia corymbosa var. corymbosa]|uniref:OLC1v1008691C1 n=1 Tax=Oldenlandia corymbosa var. corymbosa TaxID=529605 RepID=A0AAV1DPN1_OLDCO|nr:OLC1v1008691C1 [Oldenlandia corymbosa var. corymbosa]